MAPVCRGGEVLAAERGAARRNRLVPFMGQVSLFNVPDQFVEPLYHCRNTPAADGAVAAAGEGSKAIGRDGHGGDAGGVSFKGT